MMIPFVPVRCEPSDLLNPFPPLYVTTAVCSALLFMAVLWLFLTSKSVPAALQSHWQHWAKPLALFIDAGATLGAVELTVWIWLQSHSFVAWCSPIREQVSAQNDAYHAAEAGALITVTVTALLLLMALAMALYMRWQRHGPRTSASTAG